MRMPNDERQNASSIEMHSTSMICKGPSLRPSRGKRSTMRRAWMEETAVPLSAFPTTMEDLDMGAASISFMNPNSLSQIMEIEEKMELKRMVMPIIPGKMNCI